MPLWRPGEQLCSWYPSRLLDGSSWSQAVEARKPQLSDPMGKLPPRLPFHFIVVFTVVHPAHRHQPVPGSPGSECDTDLPQLALEVGVTLTYPLAVWKWVWSEHVEWPEKAFVLTWIFQSKIVVRYTRVFFFLLQHHWTQGSAHSRSLGYNSQPTLLFLWRWSAFWLPGLIPYRERPWAQASCLSPRFNPENLKQTNNKKYRKIM